MFSDKLSLSLPIAGTVTRQSVRGRFGATWVYTVVLPGHYEKNDPTRPEALILVDGGTHTAQGTGLDWVRSICRKYNVVPHFSWKG